MRNVDKFRGCLIGGAAGDALGFVVEFMSEYDIFSIYGQDGITKYELTGGCARISDDTQMTLFTANGLLYAAAHGLAESYENYIRMMYKCWYKTQTEHFKREEEVRHSWLLDIPELFSRRAPGNTCMTAIRGGAKGSVENPVNNSKGCGGVMRVAPVGLYFCDKEETYEQSDMIAAEAAALTHGHDMGYIPAAALAHIVRAAAEGNSTLKAAVSDSISAMKALFPNSKYLDEFTDKMEKAVMLAETEENDINAIHQLGEGWVGDEALAIAVYCALRYEQDFDRAIRAAVNHNGDSDSTGAICGNILGAYIGYDAIPAKYKEELELHDIILEMADDLCHDCTIGEQNENPTPEEIRREKKYVHGRYPEK